LEVRHLLKQRVSSRKVQRFEDLLLKFFEKEKTDMYRKSTLLSSEFEYFRSLYLEAFCTYFFDTDPTATLRKEPVPNHVQQQTTAPLIVDGHKNGSIRVKRENAEEAEGKAKEDGEKNFDKKFKEGSKESASTQQHKANALLSHNYQVSASVSKDPSPPNSQEVVESRKGQIAHQPRSSSEPTAHLIKQEASTAQKPDEQADSRASVNVISSDEEEESSEESSEDDEVEIAEIPVKKSPSKKSNTGILSQIEKLIETAPVQSEPEDEQSQEEANSPIAANKNANSEVESERKIEGPITDQAKMRDMSRDRLHQQRKLMLFLDIDHTIVHSTKDSQAKRFLKHPTLGMSVVKLHFTNQYNCPYYVIKRPGLMKFLREVTQKYNVVLYTMGSRAYAESVCKVIDPDSTLIRNRIISREDRYDKNLVDEKDRPIKSIQEFFPLYKSTAMIVDDTSNVWTDPEDVYKVSKFLFWGADSSGDTNEHTSLDWNPNRMGVLFTTDRELYRALEDLDEIYNSYFRLLDSGEMPSAPKLMRNILSKRFTK